MAAIVANRLVNRATRSTAKFSCKIRRARTSSQSGTTRLQAVGNIDNKPFEMHKQSQQLAISRTLNRSKRRIFSRNKIPETLQIFTSVKLTVIQLQRLQFDRCVLASTPQSGYHQFVTYPEEDVFRCTRTLPCSVTPSGILRASDCGCGRAAHRRVHTQHGYGSRRVLVPKQLGHTNAIPSVAPNSAANAAAELGHTGDIYASFTQNAESVGEGTQGRRTRQHEPKGEAGRCRDAFISFRRPVPPPYDTTTRTVALHITQRTPAATSS